MEGDYGRKLQKGKAGKTVKGNEKREAGEEVKGTGKGQSALVAGDRRLCQWGPG